MVVCKFFMEGYCKFGNQCRFEHSDRYHINYEYRRSDYDRPSGTSVLKASTTSFSSQQHQFGQGLFQGHQQDNSSVSQRYNIKEVMQVISRDVFIAEKGNQWPFTCYSPFKDLMNIPELIDYSPEELRLEYYIAVQNGQTPMCQAILQQLTVNAAKMNNKLRDKDTAYVVIERWLQEAETTQSQQGGSSVGSNNFESFNMTSTAQMYSNTQPAEINFSFSLPQQTMNAQFQQQPVTSGTQQPLTSSTQQGFFVPTTNTFQQQPTSGSIFGGSQMNVESSRIDLIDNSAYSLVEELSESELEAFKGRFVFGCIPTKPPPKELCG